jgi:predicted nucleotidyltransferase
MFGVQQSDNNIIEICKRYAIKSLFVVGSVARGDETEDSDIDLLVVFRPLGSPIQQYMGAKNDFEKILKHKVDLIENSAIRNPYFRESIEADRVLLYEEK